MFRINFIVLFQFPNGRLYPVPGIIDGEFPELHLSVISAGGIEVWRNPDWMQALGEWKQQTSGNNSFRWVPTDHWDEYVWVRIPEEMWEVPTPENGIATAEKVISWLATVSSRSITVKERSAVISPDTSWEERKRKLGDCHQAILNIEEWRRLFDEH